MIFSVLEIAFVLVTVFVADGSESFEFVIFKSALIIILKCQQLALHFPPISICSLKYFIPNLLNSISINFSIQESSLDIVSLLFDNQPITVGLIKVKDPKVDMRSIIVLSISFSSPVDDKPSIQFLLSNHILLQFVIASTVIFSPDRIHDRLQLVTVLGQIIAGSAGCEYLRAKLLSVWRLAQFAFLAL